MMARPIIKRNDLDWIFGSLLLPGDSVLAHASLSALGWFEEGPNSIIDALLKALGDQGNLIMPTATTSFAKTGFFDTTATPSETGLLSETFRKRTGVLRSCVPMASFAAIGPNAKRFCHPYHSYLDPDSPFSALLDHDGKVMLLGVDYRRCTLYHLAEERNQLDYNCYKMFEGTIVEPDGDVHHGGQRYFVRKDLSVKKNANPVGFDFEENGQVNVEHLGDSTIRVFCARAFDDFCMRAVAENPRIFLAEPQHC